MHRLRNVCAALCLVGDLSCATTTSAPSHHHLEPERTPAPLASTALPPPTPPRKPERVSRCVSPASPRPKVVPLLSGTDCHPSSKVMQVSTRGTLAKRFEKQHDRGRPEITFQCDGLGPRIREIVVEGGEGHGFNLTMWRARLSDDNDHYDIRGIAYSGQGYIKRPEGTPNYQLMSGVIDHARLDSHLEEARVALSADVQEVVPPRHDPPGTSGIDGVSMSFSSEDFHVLVKLTDTEGRIFEKEFTGYRSNTDQEKYLSPDLAAST